MAPLGATTISPRRLAVGVRRSRPSGSVLSSVAFKKRWKARNASPPTEKLLDGVQEAKVIATRLGPPPKGYANWTLRLLARQVVELEIAESISYETVRRTLKKTG